MKLRKLYDSMTTEQREELAAKAGIKPAYLYQIATRWRGKKPSVDAIGRLAAADNRLKAADLIAEFTA